MEARRLRAVLPGHEAATHGALVPDHFAHVGQCLGDRRTGARDHRQQPHVRRDPLLAFVALAGRHEELDRPLDHDLLAAHDAGHPYEVDGQVDRLLAFHGPELDLGGQAFEFARRTAGELFAQRIVIGRGIECLWCLDRQHRTRDRVRPVGRQALEPGLPGLHVQAPERLERIVGRHVHGLGDRRVDEPLDRHQHLQVLFGRHVQRGHECGGQAQLVAAALPE